MFSTRLLQIGIAGSACAAMLFAADFWKTKDSTQWTPDEVNKILSDSPWAKARTIQPQENTGQRGMGRRGGFGFPGGGGYPGGGYPGGGGGYPGGGYPGGGGRYPGNGGGYPQAGGDPNGSGDGANFPSRNEPMNLTIRWESASPIQQALMRQRASASDESKPVSELAEKYYVIEVLGWRMPRTRNRSVVDADDSSSNPNDDAPRPARSQNNDALRSQLLDAAQLAPKGKSSIYAADVQIMGPEGIDGLRFLFPRTTPLSAADKDVEFILNFRRIRVEEKFKLSEMQYEGKLAL